MSAPVFGSAGAGSATATSGAAHNVACPATVNAGDVLIVHLMYEGATVAPSTPAGWTLLNGPVTTDGGRMWIFGKVADGTEDGTNVNFGSPANTNNRIGRMYLFTGARSDTISNIVGGFNLSTASTAAITDAAVTTTEADSLAIQCVGVHDDNAVGDFTGETGGNWTEAIAEYTQAATTPDSCLQLQTATMASAGTISGGSFTMAAADPWGVVGFYIRGVAAGGTTFNQALTATVTASASVQKQANKIQTATVTASATVQKQVNKAVTATVNVTASVRKQVNKVLSAAVAVSGTLQKQVNKVLRGDVTSTASMQRQIAKNLTASVTAVGSLAKQISKSLVANVTVVGSILSQKVLIVVLTATVNVSATMQRQINKILRGDVTISGSVTKLITKTLMAAVTSTASLVANKVAAGGEIIRRGAKFLFSKRGYY